MQTRGCLCLIRAAVLVVLATALPSTLFAKEPAPGTVITAANMEAYRDLLNPTWEYFLRHGMEIRVIEPKKFEWPPAYKAATEKYAGQVRLSDDGKHLVNYVAGAPFPDVDWKDDPLAGFKWMWNHEQNPIYSDNIGMGWGMELVDSSGQTERVFASDFWRRMRWRGRLYIDPKPVIPHEPAIGYAEQWGPLVDPHDLRGAGILNFRYTDPGVPDDSYMYLPELRKVRRLSIANRSDSFWGTDIDIDSIWAFNAKIEYWDFRVLAVKPALVPWRAGGYGRSEAWCAPADGSAGIESHAFCGTWEVRPTVVVEGRPTGYSQYAYSKKVTYVDRESHAATMSEVYDQGGQLWKAWYMAMDEMPPDDPEIADPPTFPHETVVATRGGMVDFQLQHTSRWEAPDNSLWPKFGIKHWYVDQEKPWNEPETFTINYLISSARF